MIQLSLETRVLSLFRFAAPRALFATIGLLAWSASVAAQSTPGPRVSTWTPNGVVSMLAIDGNTLYVGGTFDYVGPLTGGFGVVDAADATVVNTDARIMTGATAIATDGGAGWFVLTGSGLPSPQTILHVLPSGQRDPSWTTPTVTGTASGLAFAGGRVYVWGFVTAVNGVTRNGIAALDGTTGTVLPWNAQVNHPSRQPAVLEAAFEGGRAYVGGFFATIGGEARAGFAVLDATTGAVLPATLPDDPAPGLVAIAASGSRVYVSGFCAAGSPTLRAYDADLVPLPGWAPVPTIGEVLATPSAVFHATWSGTTTRVSALEPSTGVALPFSPVTVGHSAYSEVRALAVAHGRLYIAGTFETVNGQPWAHVVAVDAVTGTPAPWRPAVGGQTMALAVDASHVAIGGGFRSIGGIAKRNLVTLDLVTGRPLTPNAPDVAFTVQAVLRLGEVVVAAGDAVFTNAGPQPNVVAYSRQSGALLPWSLTADSNVTALATDGRELFIGGSFLSLSGSRRPALASVDLQTAAITSWDFGIDGGIQRLQVSGHTLYALGHFGRAQGEPRFNIAAFDTVARQVLPFNPAPGLHSDLALSGNKVLLAGRYFPAEGGVSGFRWVDATTGEDTTPVTSVAQPGTRLAAAGSTVYGTTQFTSPTQLERIIATDTATGVAVAFAPGGHLNDAFAASAEYIAVGIASALPPIEFGETMAVYRTPRPGAPRAVTANVSGSSVTLGWQRGAPPAATSFTVEVGTATGATNVGAFPVGTATRESGALASGTYFTRVRSVGANGPGAASSEAILIVPPPSTAPAAPGTLTASSADGVVSLAWGAAAGNATTYVIEAGSAPGLANLAVFQTGHLDTAFATPAPPGRYYVRVRAANTFGASAPSNEIVVVVP